MGRLMDEMGVVLGRFGDDGESTLFDRYERLSFELQLNQAILGRSLSEPSTLGRRPIPLVNRLKQQARGLRRPGDQGSPPHPHPARPKSRFQRVLNKLLKPILGGGTAATTSTRVATKINLLHVKDCNLLRKPFSRSMRA